MSSKIVDICLSTLKREDVKKDIKILFSPIIDLILIDIYPYIYLSLIFVFISFILHLGIFILLFRNKSVFSSKIY
jgi:hypothetical protein